MSGQAVDGLAEPPRLGRPDRVALDLIYGLLFAAVVAALLLPVGQTLRRRAVWIAAALAVTFLRTPDRTPLVGRFVGSASPGERAVAAVLAGLALAPTGYLVVNYADLVRRVSGILPVEVYLGALLLALVIEATRRTMGTSGAVLAGLAVVAVAYMLWGHHLPGGLGHSPISLDRTVERLYLGTGGVFGFVLGAIVRYVIPLLIFGKALEVLGATDYLMEVAETVAGRTSSGPAKLAVVASALMGTISGTVVGNIATTGSMTVPTMKEAGVAADDAAAIEAAASTGGQIMPPVMGIAVFVMVTIVGMPYLEIVTRSVLPAFFYFFVVFLYIHLRGLRSGDAAPADVGVGGVDRRSLLVRTYYLLPIALLVALLVRGLPVATSALLATGAMLVVGLHREESRLSVGRVRRIVRESMGLSVSLVMIAGTIGVVVEVIGSTGLGLKFSSLVVGLAGGRTVLILLFTMVASLLLGMGMSSTVVSYILLATLVAPALTRIGYEPLVAHLFVFYFGMFALITPPVGVGLYAAAGIADADGLRAGAEALRICLPGFLLPFLFVANDGLLLYGSAAHVVGAVALAAVVLVSVTVAQVGYLRGELSRPARSGFVLVAGGAAVLLVLL